MAKLKQLVDKDKRIVAITNPVSYKELKDRTNDYDLLTPRRFANKYNSMLFKPVEFNWNGKYYTIQYNHCAEPFCASYNQEQAEFKGTRRNPKRYRLSGKRNEKGIICNPIPTPPLNKDSLGCFNSVFSNWSIAEEIARLVRIESFEDVIPVYRFHKEGCVNEGSTPFIDKSLFYKQGKSRNGSQVWQCKTCKKKTHTIPNQRQSTTYGMKRNDILLSLAKLIVNKIPISRSLEILEIGASTYYAKLEIIYRKCLEFLERVEKPAFENKTFEEIWLNTDKMHYFLNNVRKKGQGAKDYKGIEDLDFQTYIVVTAEGSTNFVFRADVSYDWDTTFEELDMDTRKYKTDHLNEFANPNARLDYSIYPQVPSKNDTQSDAQYKKALEEIKVRGRYVAGQHLNSTYTTFAQYWLIKELITASRWRMVSDMDNSIMTAFYRVFADELQSGVAHHFLCRTEKDKTKKEAMEEYEEAREELRDWGENEGFETKHTDELAHYYLIEKLRTHHFHKETVSPSGHKHREWANKPIEHPLGSKDRGYYKIDCKTDLTGYSPTEKANLMLNVNDNAISSFMQMMRRRLSILERPLVGARKDGKSYIYANFNPKYAHMAITILRVYYNYCLSFKTKEYEGKKKHVTEKTPAQRLGITEKKFTLKDIIYMR
ncbi:MAG TPA: insertion element protein [Sporosarcina sp.]|nr:insertion element protein [Sporosarcina sp.]